MIRLNGLPGSTIFYQSIKYICVLADSEYHHWYLLRLCLREGMKTLTDIFIFVSLTTVEPRDTSALIYKSMTIYDQAFELIFASRYE